MPWQCDPTMRSSTQRSTIFQARCNRMRVSELVKSIEDQIALNPKSASTLETAASRAGSHRAPRQQKPLECRDEPEVISEIDNHVSEQAGTGHVGRVLGEDTAQQQMSEELDIDGNLDTHVELTQQHQYQRQQQGTSDKQQKVDHVARITMKLGVKQPLLEEAHYVNVETKPELKQDHLRQPEKCVLTSTAEMDIRCQSDLTGEISIEACINYKEQETTYDYRQSEPLALESSSHYSELTDEKSGDEPDDDEWNEFVKRQHGGLDNKYPPLQNDWRRERSLRERFSEDDGSMLTDEAEIDIDRALKSDDMVEMLSNYRDTVDTLGEHQPQPHEAEPKHSNLNTKCLNEKAIEDEGLLTLERNLCDEADRSHICDTFNDVHYMSGTEDCVAIDRDDVEHKSDVPATELHLEHLQDHIPHQNDMKQLSTGDDFSRQDHDRFSEVLHRDAILQESPPESRNPKDTTPFEYDQKSSVSRSEANDVNKLLQEMEMSMDKPFHQLEVTCQRIAVVMQRLQQYLDETKHIDTVATVTDRSAQSATINELTTNILSTRNDIPTIPLSESIETDSSNLGISSELRAFVSHLESTTENAIAGVLLEDFSQYGSNTLDEAPSDEAPVSLMSSQDESEVSSTFLSREVMELNATEVRSGKMDDYHSGSESSRHFESSDDESTGQNDTREPAPLEWTSMPAIVELQHGSAAALEQLVGFLDEQQTILGQFCLRFSCGNHNDDGL